MGRKSLGRPEKPGEVFAIRIHNDAGYIAMPHVHPMDEHVVVVQGAWWFGMGSRFEPSALKEVKLGDFTIGPKNMPHFGWAKVETTIHVFGIGPFRSTLIDPVYELTGKGIFLLLLCFNRALRPIPVRRTVSRSNWGRTLTVPGTRVSLSELAAHPLTTLLNIGLKQRMAQRCWATLQELKHD